MNVHGPAAVYLMGEPGHGAEPLFVRINKGIPSTADVSAHPHFSTSENTAEKTSRHKLQTVRQHTIPFPTKRTPETRTGCS